VVQIESEFSEGQLPKFPPKKMNMSFFALGDEDLEERRQSLETYMQQGGISCSFTNQICEFCAICGV